MMKKVLLSLIPATILLLGVAVAQIVGTLPFTLTNNTVADANQVMANFNAIRNGVNLSAAGAGANTNITSLTGLTSPIPYTVGGASVYISGASTGSANAQVVASPVPTGFTLVAGKSVIFTAGFTNTAAMTLNVNATGVKNVYQPGVGGPVALSGGEVITNNVVFAVYDGTQFQLTTPPQSSVIPVGTSLDYRGLSAPTGFLFENGAAVSRTTYANLFSFLTFTSAATTTSGSKIVTGISSTTTLAAGMPVGGNNVTCGDTIATVDSATQVTLTTNNASASGATTLVFAPYGAGDCSATFSVPDSRGRVSVARDNMGTGAASRLTATSCTNPSTSGSGCGAQTRTLVTGNLPAYTPAGTNKLNTSGFVQASAQNVDAGATQTVQGNSGNITLTVDFEGTAQGGVSTPVVTLQPSLVTNRIIKY